MKALYVGNPALGGEGRNSLSLSGHVFVKGEWVEVRDADLRRRLPGNNHFEIDTDGDGDTGPTVEALRADLDALGVKYHHKAGVEKLSALLDEATKPA